MLMRWNAVCVSIPDEKYRTLVEQEFQLLRNLQIINCDEFIIVEDACEDVGSAGSALNALLITTERLCARQGFTVLQEGVLESSNILIILMGNIENAFRPLHDVSSWKNIPQTIVLLNIATILQLARTASHGVWITGTNSSFHITDLPKNLAFNRRKITSFSFVDESSLASQHGCFLFNDKNELVSLTYRPNKLGKKNHIILGIIFMPASVAISFLSLHSNYPVSATTYHGIDTGVIGLKLSLFFDIVLATVLDKHSYLKFDEALPKTEPRDKERAQARLQIHKVFKYIRTNVVTVEVANYVYNSSKNLEPEKLKIMLQSNRNIWTKNLLSIIRDPKKPCEDLLKVLQAVDEAYNEKHLKVVLEQIEEDLKRGSLEDLAYAAKFSRLADLMTVLSNGAGGIKSGPASNPEFQPLFEALVTHKLDADIRKPCFALYLTFKLKWFNTPTRLVRGARHADATVQLIISRQVVTELSRVCSKPIIENYEKLVELPRNVRVKSAARIDLCGGWLDTPPITFMVDEPAVINMAILYENQYPLSCFIERSDKDEGIEILLEDSVVSLKTAHDLYKLSRQPTEPGSLVCACLVAIGVITNPQDDLLHRIKLFYKCMGLKIKCNSILAHGSGLGTSSILAACIIKGILTAAGVKEFSNKEIVYTVLYVEQILTTGGGWQDQVGGIYPGIKYGVLGKKGLYKVDELKIPENLQNEISDRLILIQTGSTRLAKNLLQEVIRGWFSGNEVKEQVKLLQHYVPSFRQQLELGNFPIDSINKYFDVKKKLAPGCVPGQVAILMDQLKNAELTETSWFAGAGGGGYLCAWLKPDITIADVRKLLTKVGLPNMEAASISLSSEPIICECNI